MKFATVKWFNAWCGVDVVRSKAGAGNVFVRASAVERGS
jgi:cold shock CspA family protein